MNNGYVSVPREFFDSIQWRRKRIFTESEAYLDLLQNGLLWLRTN